jgi:hypothetical protein
MRLLQKLSIVMAAGVLALGSLQRPVTGQTFTCGSSGSDGAFNLTTPGITVFNPASYAPPLDPKGDNIFNFTTLTIAAGSTLKLSGSILHGPVYFLASGAVQISGTIDLSGSDGEASSPIPANRFPAAPGAGGFAGGVETSGSNAAQSGDGPSPGSPNYGGGFSGNQFLVPLIGGSGGGGGTGGGGGGAGGGALLIASCTSITLTGTITANGGHGNGNANNCVGGGGGAGGAIRLAAPAISGSGGTLSVAAGGGNQYQCNQAASNGLVRVEAFQDTLSATVSGPIDYGTPYSTFATPAPSVRVVTIGGVAVNQSPSGSFTVPDVTVNSATALPVNITASNIPIGTTVTLLIYSENGADQTIVSTGLAGTVASSTATASVTLPAGYSYGFVKASWTQ